MRDDAIQLLSKDVASTRQDVKSGTFFWGGVGVGASPGLVSERGDVLFCFSPLGSTVKENTLGIYQLPRGQLWSRKS